MAVAKKGSWIGGTVFAALVIVVAAWFLAINPTLSATAEVRDQTAQANSQNDVLENRVAKLKADFAKMKEYRGQLDALRVQIPSTALLSDYLRQIDAIAVARQVAVTTVAPGTPSAVVAAPAPAPVAQPTPTPSATPQPTATASGAGTTTDPAAAKPDAVPVGFTAIPLSVTVLGSYDNTLAFLSDLQTAAPRLFLVSGFTATAQKDADATGGKPATHVGDQELVITGFLFALPDTAPVATPTPTPTPVVPGPIPGKNPLVPVGGNN